MTEEKYRQELKSSLDREKSRIISRLNAFLNKVPSEAVRINIIISPSQDGEGDFSIYGGLNGPNLYSLNKKVQDWTSILNIRNTPVGFQPSFPMVDPFNSSFYVNDVIEEVCIKWFQDHWEEIDEECVKVAISIYSDHI